MNRLIYIILFIYACIGGITIAMFDGTGDSGDSVNHYLYAKYALAHPELFFDHWAKPLFVLLSCPFAQMGFIGMKIFNALVSLFTIFFTYKIAERLNLKNAIVVTLLLAFAPLYYVLTFSGLTEPLCALLLAICLYLAATGKNIQCCLLLSLMPFVRSEGLIIIGVFALYFLLKKDWKVLPYLLFGTLAYSVAGYFVFHDLLWTFTKIPYAKLSSVYGSGTLFHFVEQLFYVVGLPIYIFFWIGVVAMLVAIFKKKIVLEEHVLILFGFTCFFVAHTLFWYLGIFNSMGLKRVFIAVLPLIALISLQGYNFICETLFDLKQNAKTIVQIIFIALIIIFPFTGSPAAVKRERDLDLTKEQSSLQEAAKFISQNKPNAKVLTAHPYMSEALQIDCFDKTKQDGLSPNIISQANSNDIIVWENWYALYEAEIKKESLDSDPNLKNIYNSKITADGREIVIALYQKK